MTDTPDTTTNPDLTYTVYHEKKVSDGNYGGETTGIFVQTTVPAGTDPLSDVAQTALRNAANAAKAQVAVSLGFLTEIDDEGTLVYSKAQTVPQSVAAAFPGATVASGSAGSSAGGSSGDVDGDSVPPHINPTRGSAEEKANTKWATQRFAVAPSEFFDNRDSKRAANHPDIKSKKYNRNGGWDSDLVGWLN